MKRFLFMIGMLLVASSLQAASITFQWDAKPSGQTWTKVRVYEKMGTTYTLLIEVNGTETQATAANVTPGSHAFVARSFDGVWESADSNTVTTGTPPTAPGNFRILTVVLAGIAGFGILLWALIKKVF
jgi:hypothetical protein